MRKILIPTALALALVAMAAPRLQATPQEVTPTPVATAPTTGPATPAALSPEMIAALTAALQDERNAQLIYGAVIEDFGEVLPFLHTRQAEARHAAAIEAIFLRRGLAVPGQKDLTVPRYASLLDACTAAVQDEQANVALYDRLLALDPPADVVPVAERNRLVSLEHHLPAYQRCVDGGGTYSPPADRGCKGMGPGGGMGHGPGAGMGAGKGMGPGPGAGGGMGGGCCAQCPRRGGAAS